jgi:CHAT domain-containing protein
MFLVPFEVLEIDGHTLLTDKVISYTTSFETIPWRKDNDGEAVAGSRIPSGLLVVGNPTYGLSGKQGDATNSAFRRDAAGPSMGKASVVGYDKELVGSKEEVNQLRARFGLKEGQDLLSEIGATRKAVINMAKRGDLAKFRWIVFSAHAVLDPRLPLRSAIVLSPGSLADDESLYTIRDILSSTPTLNADLVLLSACETGVGQVLIGEGVQSLAYAFLAIGAKRVIATLWPIKDTSSAVFVTTLFEMLRRERDLTVAKALAETKRQMLSQHRAASLWAPFLLYGAP